ncbi:unnamed protein product [Orchesella dallaii]|uniref:C2H2-type domain-containing protein n=1 Tax=Orchesella dallaii TaxID=48710 RepID=A0ABP1S1R1_9HEXA
MPAQSKEDCFPCKVCDKSFKQNYYLRRHMTIHDTPTFLCSDNDCDMAFRTEKGLKKHETIHSKKRPHKCKLCNKTYKRTQDLKRHLKLHLNNIKPVETFVSKTTRTSDSTTGNVNGRKLASKKPAMGKAMNPAEVSLHLVGEIQLGKTDSVREFDEPPKPASPIISQSSSTVTELDSSLTANQKEQPQELFPENDTAATAENMIIKVYVGAGESSQVPEQSSSNLFQTIFQQIMDELAMAGSETVNDNQL